MTAVEVYDSTTDTWMKGVDLQTPRFGLATAVADGKIYATGGGHFGQPLSTLEVYDTGFEGNAQSVNPAGKLPTLWGKLKAR